MEIGLIIPKNLTQESKDLIVEFAKEEEKINHHDPQAQSYHQYKQNQEKKVWNEEERIPNKGNKSSFFSKFGL